MDPATSRAPHALTPASQIICYSERLKVSVALRYALTYLGFLRRGRKFAGDAL